MSDDWRYTEEPAPDPHALCCRTCAKARESVARLQNGLRDMREPLVEAATELQSHGQHPNRTDQDHVLRNVAQAIDLARALLGSTEDTAPPIEGGFIDQPMRREMGVDAPDFGPMLGSTEDTSFPVVNDDQLRAMGLPTDADVAGSTEDTERKCMVCGEPANVSVCDRCCE